MPSHIPNVLDPDTYSTKDERAEFAAGLRALADWVETTEFPIHRYCLGHNAESPFQTVECHGYWYHDDPDFVQRAGLAARLIGGKVEKGVAPYSTDFSLTKDFGGGVRFTYRIARSAVCTAREVEKPVEIEVPVDATRAAQLAAEMDALRDELAKIPTTKVQDIEVVKEFDCPPSLLAALPDTSEPSA